jgi:UDP-N-acetylglucosamine enolpyruvyl transferase
MNKEYEIVYCKECNAVKITDEDRNCLICNGTSELIGFEHKVIQDILEVEQTTEENNG